MNWLQKVAQQEGIVQEERIVEAIIYISGELFAGENHGVALNKALDAGAIKRDEEGRLEGYPGPDIHLDLFRTNTGRIIDRFQASEEFDFSGY